MAQIKRKLQDFLKGQITVIFFEYSANKEYYLQPDIAKYDDNVMTKPGFDLILSSNTMKEFRLF